jgi:predicted DNA-binding protein
MANTVQSSIRLSQELHDKIKALEQQEGRKSFNNTLESIGNRFFEAMEVVKERAGK